MTFLPLRLDILDKDSETLGRLERMDSMPVVFPVISEKNKSSPPPSGRKLNQPISFNVRLQMQYTPPGEPSKLPLLDNDFARDILWKSTPPPFVRYFTSENPCTNRYLFSALNAILNQFMSFWGEMSESTNINLSYLARLAAMFHRCSFWNRYLFLSDPFIRMY